MGRAGRSCTVATRELVLGSDGDDTFVGTSEGESIMGLSGDDLITPEGGDDFVYGGEGDDTLNGRDDGDELYGDAGDDRLNGEGGQDALNDGTGNDTILGGNGRDELWCGAGDDILTGAAGQDTFVFTSGADVVTDFKFWLWEKRISFRASAHITDYADLVANHMSRVGADVVTDDGAGNTMTLKNVNMALLYEGDFLF